MRIALVSEYYYPHLGGVTEHVHNLAAQYRSLGHEAVIVTSRVAGDGEERAGVRYVGRSRVVYANGSFARMTTAPRLRARIAEVFEEERIDIVHVHGALSPTLGLFAPGVAFRMGIPAVATFHSWFPRSVGYRLFRRVMQRDFDRLSARIAVSEPVVRAFSRYFGGAWEIIPNGVDVEHFHPNGRRPMEVTNTPRLLFLGRLDPRNGLDTMLAAMPSVLKRHPRAELVIVGDGPLRRLYEGRAQALGPGVRFAGRVLDERWSYYAHADIYVCPTERASFGITLLEAMACGTPMLVSDIIGFRELVDGGREAALVPPNDPAAWANGITKLLDEPELRSQMGAAGREKALLFSWERVAAQVMELYERVLGRRKVGAWARVS